MQTGADAERLCNPDDACSQVYAISNKVSRLTGIYMSDKC